MVHCLIMKTLVIAVICATLASWSWSQIPDGAAKPGIIVEQEGGKTIAHLTLPGTKVRDYTKPSFIIEKSGDTLLAYPTVVRTSVRDFAKDPITFDTQKNAVTSPSLPQVKRPEARMPLPSLGSVSTPSFEHPALPRVGATPPQVNGSSTLGAIRVNPYSPNSLANPYGAGSPYKPDGLMNPYSAYGSPYSPKSWKNPYATDTPRLVDQSGNYRGKFSANPYDPDSVSNPYGRFGNRYSPDSIKNPYGAGNPYSTTPVYVVKPDR